MNLLRLVKRDASEDHGRTVDEFVRSIALVTDPEALGISITNWFCQIAGASQGTFLAPDDQGDFRPAFSSGVGDAGIAFRPGGTLCRWLRQNRCILSIPDANGVWDYLDPGERAALSNHRAHLCVPLSSANTLSAIVLLSSASRASVPHTGQGANVLMLQSLARQAALAYDHALMFEAQRERLHSLYASEQFIVAGQMAATIAHEVKNPLATIRATLQYLTTSEPSDHLSSAQLLNASLMEVDRIDRAVRALLNLSRPHEATNLDVDLVECCRDALPLVHVYARAKGVKIQTDFEDGPLVVVGDAKELRRVIVNLLLNACEARAREILISARRAAPEEPSLSPSAEILVRDDGAGLSEQDLARAFDPFFTTKPQGTGLGLSICLQVVRRHGGTLDLLPGESGGMTARLRLPLPRPEQ
jgi:signal transduction histidine kinase